MKKIILCVLSIVFVFSFFSCKKIEDDKIDEANEMVVFDKKYVKKLLGDDSFELPINKNVEDRNYFKLYVNSNIGLKGTLFYQDMLDDSNILEEDFYIDKRDYIFNLIIGQEEMEKYDLIADNRRIIKITFSNLEKISGEVTVSKIVFDKKELSLFNITYIEDEKLKIGVNLNWGGGLFYAATKQYNVYQIDTTIGENDKSLIGIDYDNLTNSKVSFDGLINLLNYHDVGRLVQQAYYGTSQPPYEMGSYLGNRVCYNPVQGGDQKENESKIVDYEITQSSVYVKCQPRDWAPAKICAAYMENWYTINDGVLKLDNRFVDYTNFIPERRDQEMPAVYTVRSFDKWIVYDGDFPFQNKNLSSYYTKGNNAGNRIVNNKLTENWVALCNNDDFGVGIYVPDLVEGIFSTFGYNDVITNTNDPDYGMPQSMINATTYTTMITRLSFETLKPVEYTSYLAVGYVNDMRSKFYELKSQGANNLSIIHYNN